MGLNTACWRTSKTYTMTPLQGLIVSIFLQPGGNADIGHTVSWAAENALNVAVNVAITFLSPNAPNQAPTAVAMIVPPGIITPTYNWVFPEGASNFQIAAHTP